MTELRITDSNGIFHANPRSGLAVDMDNRAIAYWNVTGPDEAHNLDGLLQQVHLRVGQRLVRVEYQAFRVGLITDRHWAVFARPINASSKILFTQVGQANSLANLLDQLYRDSLVPHPLHSGQAAGPDPRFQAFAQYNTW